MPQAQASYGQAYALQAALCALLQRCVLAIGAPQMIIESSFTVLIYPGYMNELRIDRISFFLSVLVERLQFQRLALWCVSTFGGLAENQE